MTNSPYAKNWIWGTQSLGILPEHTLYIYGQ